MASTHPTLLKATKLKLNEEERLVNNSLVTLCAAKYTAEDLRDGSNIDTEFLYEQVQGKLRRCVNPKILIVMRSRFQAGAFAQVLKRHGCEVIVATNGHKAYTSYLRKNSAEFSLCLCQWYLPGIAGRDLAYYEAESGGRLPFVALLGPGQRATDAIRSGADLFLKLPLYPQLRWVLGMVLPHTSTMAQFRVGAMHSNFEGMRRLLGTQQDVLRHTIETNTLSDLVKADLASITEISSVEIGMNMLEAVMASIRMQEAATANAAAEKRLQQAELITPQKRSGQKKASTGAGGRKLLKPSSTPDPDSTQQLLDAQQLSTVKDAQFHALAASFRNVMLVMNKVRNSLISTQQENHSLRERANRNAEQAELLRGQLRSHGVDIIDAKLERLYLPRRLTRSPPPPDPTEPPFHENIENDPEVDATQFTKQDLMRALRAAKAAITSANEEVDELADDLQRLQEYQIEVEDDLVQGGMAVHFHIGGGDVNGQNPSPADLSSQLKGSTTKDGAGGAGAAGRIAEDAIKQMLVRKRSLAKLQDNGAAASAGRLARTLSMLGPRLQDELARQQSMHESVAGSMVSTSVAESLDDDGSSVIVGDLRTPQLSRVKSDVTKRRGLNTSSPFVVSLAPTTAPVAGGEGEFHLQRSKKRKEDSAKLFFARRYFWASHALQSLESQCMANEDARQSTSSRVSKPVPPVPKCVEKPATEVTNALEGLLNGVIALHNQVAVQVNTCTAKIGALFPAASQSLRDVSIGVKDALQSFNASQHISAIQLYVDGRITKLISEERQLWAQERCEMEKYRLQNPPGSRKLIADLRLSVRDLRMQRWRDWFQTLDTKVRANYLRKWIVWFLHRSGEKTWKLKSRQLETEMQSQNAKKVAEQVAFARKQSVDGMAKQSQQRIDFEQLQIKHMRVSQLFEESKAKVNSLTKEVEGRAAELTTLKERKEALDAAICEKSDEIVRLMHSVAPMEEELMATRATLGEREQKILTLQGQVTAYHRKVQQLSGAKGGGSFTGLPQPKTTQTAISNANCASLLDDMVKSLGARQRTNSVDMGALERKLSGSIASMRQLPSGELLNGGGGEVFSTPMVDSEGDEGDEGTIVQRRAEVPSPQESIKSGGAPKPPPQHPSAAAPAAAPAPAASTAAKSVAPKKTAGKGGRAKSVVSTASSVRSNALAPRQQQSSRTMSINSALESSLLPPRRNPSPSTASLKNNNSPQAAELTPGAADVPSLPLTATDSKTVTPQTPPGHTLSGGGGGGGGARCAVSPSPPPMSAFPPVSHPQSFEVEGPSGYEDDNNAPREDGRAPSQLSATQGGGDTIHEVATAAAADIVVASEDGEGGALLSDHEPVSHSSIAFSSRTTSPAHEADDATSPVSAREHPPAPQPTHHHQRTAKSKSLQSASFDLSCTHQKGSSPGSHLHVPRRRAVSLTASFATDGDGDVDPSVAPSERRLPNSHDARADVTPMSSDVSSLVPPRDAFDDPVAPLLVDRSLSAMSIPSMVACGVQSSFSAVSPTPQHDGAPQAVLGTVASRVTSGGSSDEGSPPRQHHPPLDLSDTSRWHSALHELTRQRRSNANASLNASSITATTSSTVSGIGNIVDVTRRLMDVMSIPQNTLIKTTDASEMIESLHTVLEAAVIAIAARNGAATATGQRYPTTMVVESSIRRSGSMTKRDKKEQQQQENTTLLSASPKSDPPPLPPTTTLPPIVLRHADPATTTTAAVNTQVHLPDIHKHHHGSMDNNQKGGGGASPSSAVVTQQSSGGTMALSTIETTNATAPRKAPSQSANLGPAPAPTIHEKKQVEREKKAAQANIAVMLQREMLRQPQPRGGGHEGTAFSPRPPHQNAQQHSPPPPRRNA